MDNTDGQRQRYLFERDISLVLEEDQAMGLQIIESTGAKIPGRNWRCDIRTRAPVMEMSDSARSRVPRSFDTAISPDIAESEAYKQSMLRGEIGLQRPVGVNDPGVDFITAVRNGATGIKEIVCTDVTSSRKRKPYKAKTSLPGSWLIEVQAAVSKGRLHLELINTDVPGLPRHTFPLPSTRAELEALETQIVQAANQVPLRIRLRLLKVDYRPTGQGTITGW